MLGRAAGEAIDGLVERHPVLAGSRESVEAACSVLIEAATGGRTLFTCGNGGSSAEAGHFVGDVMKSFCQPRPVSASMRHALEAVGPRGDSIADRLETGVAAVSLVADSVLSSAVSNDIGFDMVFAQPLSVLASADDVLIVLTTSGRSENTINAAYVARALGLKVIVIGGPDVTELTELADVCIMAPVIGVDRIQDLHAPICHALAHVLEAELFAGAATHIAAQRSR